MKAVIGFFMAMFISISAHADKIAVFDFQRALLTSNAAKDYEKTLRAEFAQEQQKVVDLEKQVKAARDKVTSNKDLVSADELKKMKLQYQKVFTEYQRLGQMLQQKKMQREQAFVQQMKPQVDKVVKNLIDQEGIEVVISRQAVYYSSDAIDITKKVVELLNKQ